MKNFLKDYAGVILVLLGAACLVIYYFMPISNVLLVLSLVLEVIGIVAHIIFNRCIK